MKTYIVQVEENKTVDQGGYDDLGAILAGIFTGEYSDDFDGYKITELYNSYGVKVMRIFV